MKEIIIPDINNPNWNKVEKPLKLILEGSNDKIYFINPSEKDNPVKIIIEQEPLSTRIEKYYLTLKEVLLEILRCNLKLRRQLTRQQIHSERGKVKRGYSDQVINFLVKRGISKEYIDKEVSQERERWIISRQIHFDNFVAQNNKIGIIQLTSDFYKSK